MTLYSSFVTFREQLMFPLHFVDMLGRFDVEASVEGGGHSSQAGALRLAISRALLAFVSKGDVENMRQGERERKTHCLFLFRYCFVLVHFSVYNFQNPEDFNMTCC